MTATQIRPATRLSPLVAAIRTAVQSHADWAETAQLVADQLRRHLPTLDVLTAAQRLGSPDDYCAHNLYVEPDGSFSIVALVWRPGQITRIHDHITWCVFGVIQGVEQEELFDADLNLVGRNENQVGKSAVSRLPATSTACATQATRRRSPSTSTVPTSPASAPAPAATTTDLDLDRKRKPTHPDYGRSTGHVTRPRPELLHLTRRLRHR